VLGDSLSNALRYPPPSLNWVEHLRASRGFDFGTGPLGEPYYYDMASIGGNTNADNAAHVQAPALAALVEAGAPIEAAVLEIGSHDLGPIGPTPPYPDDHGNPITNTYQAIYDRALTGPNLNGYIQRTLGYIMDAVGIMTDEGVRMVVANIPDFGDTPQLQTGASTADPGRRSLVTQAVNLANRELEWRTAAARIPLLDLKGLIDLGLGRPPLVVGGLTIAPSPQIGGPPFYFMDTQHPGGVPGGLLANMVLLALDRYYGYNIAPLSDQEILTNCELTPPDPGPTYYDVSRFVR